MVMMIIVVLCCVVLSHNGDGCVFFTLVRLFLQSASVDLISFLSPYYCNINNNAGDHDDDYGDDEN